MHAQHPQKTVPKTNPPTATYRFQLRPANDEKGDPGIRFRDVENYIPYLKKLGISHVYLSPITTPVAGSEHCYDVVDYHKISEDIGGEEGFRQMSKSLHDNGIKVVVDFVPNHMGIRGGQNAWWQDVLKNGPESQYANYFDIFWDQNGDHKMVMPFLGNKIEDLIKGNPPEFCVKQNTAGEYYFDYWGTSYPINKEGQAILQKASKKVHEINSTSALLQKVLDVQHYRPVFWKDGLEQLNYRRFFSISELAGLRIEDDHVFQDVHSALKQWVDEGLVDGVRIDHVDGLREPGAYLSKLRQLLGNKTYITAEKILGANETLPSGWDSMMQGTTGYDHMIAAGNLFTRPSEALSDAYRAFLNTDKPPSYPEIMRASRLMFMETEMKTEVSRLEEKLIALAKADHASIDPATLRGALKEVTAAFPVYRTYIEGQDVSDTDRAVIQTATDRAKSHAKDDLVPAIAFISRVLNQSGFKDEAYELAHDFVMAYQQFTGPVIAKGTEDTAFYRYNLLRGAVEVGAELEHLGLSPEHFTSYLQHRIATTMNASSTHDNKLGEDARARAVVLSHIPEIWASTAQSWKERFAKLASETAKDGKEITAEDRYLLFQTLVASYPLELLFDEATPFQGLDKDKLKDQYSARLQDFMVKALKEAKVNTSWIPSTLEGYVNPDEAYETTVKAFVDAIVKDQGFETELRTFTRKIARMGANVSLSQRVLQATAPGIPDIYQGSESWNFSLVDPDNRRTPDFKGLSQKLDQAVNKSLEVLSEHWPDGVVKQVLTQRLLKLREDNPDLFLSNKPGELVPLKVYGADHKENKEVLAFARTHGNKAAIIAVPVLLEGELFRQEGKALGIRSGELSGELEIELPEALRDKQFLDALNDGMAVPVERGRIRLHQAFKNIPGALLGAGLAKR